MISKLHQQKQEAPPVDTSALPTPTTAGGGGEEEAATTTIPIVAQRFKTKICKSTQKGRECLYGKKCMFAHSEKELRTIERNLAEGIVSEEAIRELKKKIQKHEKVKQKRSRKRQEKSRCVTTTTPTLQEEVHSEKKEQEVPSSSEAGSDGNDQQKTTMRDTRAAVAVPAEDDDADEAFPISPPIPLDRAHLEQQQVVKSISETVVVGPGESSPSPMSPGLLRDLNSAASDPHSKTTTTPAFPHQSLLNNSQHSSAATTATISANPTAAVTLVGEGVSNSLNERGGVPATTTPTNIPTGNSNQLMLAPLAGIDPASFGSPTALHNSAPLFVLQQAGGCIQQPIAAEYSSAISTFQGQQQQQQQQQQLLQPFGQNGSIASPPLQQPPPNVLQSPTAIIQQAPPPVALPLPTTAMLQQPSSSAAPLLSSASSYAQLKTTNANMSAPSTALPPTTASYYYYPVGQTNINSNSNKNASAPPPPPPVAVTQPQQQQYQNLVVGEILGGQQHLQQPGENGSLVGFGGSSVSVSGVGESFHHHQLVNRSTSTISQRREGINAQPPPLLISSSAPAAAPAAGVALSPITLSPDVNHRHHLAHTYFITPQQQQQQQSVSYVAAPVTPQQQQQPFYGHPTVPQ